MATISPSRGLEPPLASFRTAYLTPAFVVKIWGAATAEGTLVIWDATTAAVAAVVAFDKKIRRVLGEDDESTMFIEKAAADVANNVAMRIRDLYMVRDLCFERRRGLNGF